MNNTSSAHLSIRCLVAVICTVVAVVNADNKTATAVAVPVRTDWYVPPPATDVQASAVDVDVCLGLGMMASGARKTSHEGACLLHVLSYLLRVSIRVGTPPQWVDVFVSTASGETWVIGPGGGCDGSMSFTFFLSPSLDCEAPSPTFSAACVFLSLGGGGGAMGFENKSRRYCAHNSGSFSLSKEGQSMEESSFPVNLQALMNR